MKIRDKVRVKTNLKNGDYFEKATFIESMMPYRGKISTIIGIGGAYDAFLLDDMGNWRFDEGMLELIKEEKEENIMFKITDNSEEKVAQLPTLPFVTKDENGYCRMYFSDKDKIRYLHLGIGAINTVDIYDNINQAIKKFDILKEKIVKTELIIS